jgi:hypothetical protein
MNVRCVPIISQLTRSRRYFHFTATRFFGMASGEGVTTQELEEALKTRLSAVHTEVSDISGSSLSRMKTNGKEDVVSRMKSSLYDTKEEEVLIVGVSCFCEEDDSCTSSSCQHCAKGRNRTTPRIFSKVIHPGRMGSSAE